MKAVDNWRQSIAYAPKGTNSATARQLFIDGKVDVPARRAVGVGRAREGAGRRAAEPQDRRAAVPGDAGGASNSLHIAAKTDAKKKEAAWNFIQMAASPEWQNKYALTGSPAPRKGALTPPTWRRNPHLKVINDEAAKARNLFPEVQTVRADYNEFATHRHEGGDEDDLHAGADAEGAGGAAGGAGARGAVEVEVAVPRSGPSVFRDDEHDTRDAAVTEPGGTTMPAPPLHAQGRRAPLRLAAARAGARRRRACSSHGRSTSSCR